MHKLIIAIACAIAAPLVASPTHAQQQEITLTVAAGQPLRAMKPLPSSASSSFRR